MYAPEAWTVYKARAIANYFLERAWAESRELDPLKIQKLVYFAHGWYLGIHGQPLVAEPVEAWPFGPVFPSVYQEFKFYGRDTIGEMAFDLKDDEPWAPVVPESDSKTREVLDRVWKVYGHLSGTRLSRMTHDKDGPWARAWESRRRRGRPQGAVIPNVEIDEYFRRLGLEERDRRSSQPVAA